MSILCVQSAFSALGVKMGRGGQDESAGTGLESLRMRNRAVSWVVGHFPSRSVVQMPDIRGVSRLLIFSVFHLRGNPILNWVPNFPACFTTVADKSAMRGRAGAGKQLSSCGWLELSKASKKYESTAEGKNCFLKEVRKDKRDGANLSGWLSVIKMKRIWGSELGDLLFSWAGFSGTGQNNWPSKVKKFSLQSRNSGKLWDLFPRVGFHGIQGVRFFVFTIFHFLLWFFISLKWRKK